jgi:hypothetical protein
MLDNKIRSMWTKTLKILKHENAYHYVLGYGEMCENLIILVLG